MWYVGWSSNVLDRAERRPLWRGPPSRGLKVIQKLCSIWRKDFPATWNSISRGLETGLCGACSKTKQEAQEDTAEQREEQRTWADPTGYLGPQGRRFLVLRSRGTYGLESTLSHGISSSPEFSESAGSWYKWMQLGSFPHKHKWLWYPWIVCTCKRREPSSLIARSPLQEVRPHYFLWCTFSSSVVNSMTSAGTFLSLSKSWNVWGWIDPSFLCLYTYLLYTYLLLALQPPSKLWASLKAFVIDPNTLLLYLKKEYHSFKKHHLLDV